MDDITFSSLKQRLARAQLNQVARATSRANRALTHSRYVCPECYEPVLPPTVKQGTKPDARCLRCRRSQVVLPVNFWRAR